MKNVTGLSVRFLISLFIIITALLGVSGCGKNEKVQVIFLSIDTLRGDHLDAYGYARKTSPNLSALIKDSDYYPQTYTNGCWTYPSHMSMLTGTLPSRHGIIQDYNTLVYNKEVPKVNPAIDNIAQLFKKQVPELKTIKFAKLPDEVGFNIGFEINNRKDPFQNENRFQELLKEIENNKGNNFFMFLHTWMVHAPYANSYFLEKEKLDQDGRAYVDNFRNSRKGTQGRLKGKKYKKLADFLREHKLFNARDCETLYDSGIRYVDNYVGRLMSKLKELGLYDNTMIIIVSDHGEHFGEHYKHMFYDYHGKDYFEEFIRVPLIIKFPDQSRKAIHQNYASLIDVVPTAMDYFRLKTPNYVQGRSLLGSNKEKKPGYLLSEAILQPDQERKMIRQGNWKYIVSMKIDNNKDFYSRTSWHKIIDRRLFNLKDDPLEKKNLYKNPKFRSIAKKLERKLRETLSQSAKLYRQGKKETLKKETMDHMKSLGYL